MDIPLSSDALDVVFHPRDDTHLLAAGLISGKAQLIDYSAAVEEAQANSRTQSNDLDDAPSGSKGRDTPARKSASRGYSKRWSVRPSSKSCRGVAFDQDGSSLWSLAKDGSIFNVDAESGKIVSEWKKAHDAAPSRLLPIEKNLIATGDDDGVVKLWDPRRSTKTDDGGVAAVATYEHHFDWITSMLWCTHLAEQQKAKLTKEEQERKRKAEEKKRRKRERKDRRRGRDKNSDDEEEHERDQQTAGRRERLVCTSGDGTLSVIDVRAGFKKKDGAVEVSEDQEDELLSIAAVKRGSKLVVGTQLGVLSLWAPSRGLLDHIDRIPGHPASVDTMCQLDDDTILTGSSDGLVRVVQIMPHSLLGIVADHGGMPVERIARHGNWLASIGHGPEIKLTDLAPILEGGDEDEDEDEYTVDEVVNAHAESNNGQDEESSKDEEMKANTLLESELLDYDESSADEGSSEQESSGESDTKERHPRKKPRATATFAPTMSAKSSANEDFFADL